MFWNISGGRDRNSVANSSDFARVSLFGPPRDFLELLAGEMSMHEDEEHDAEHVSRI